MINASTGPSRGDDSECVATVHGERLRKYFHRTVKLFSLCKSPIYLRSVPGFVLPTETEKEVELISGDTSAARPEPLTASVPLMSVPALAP